MSRDFKLEPGWRPLLRDLGIDPQNMLRRAELPLDLLAREDARLSTDEYFRMWNAMQAEYGDPSFAIRLVEVATAESFSPPLFAALQSPNLLVALERLATYKRLVAPMALSVEARRQSVRATFRWLHAATKPPPSLVGMEAAFITQLARMATRERIEPIRVIVPVLPDAAGALERFLGVPLQRGKHLSMSFAHEDALRPFLTANDALWSVFEPELRRRLAELEASASMGERVRSVILELLPSGQASMGQVAAKLAVSRRTLQRRLQSEGTAYLTILAATREQLAMHYLSRTPFSLTEIAFLLGFEEPNSFFRAFHSWTGDTPESVRQSMRTRPTDSLHYQEPQARGRRHVPRRHQGAVWDLELTLTARKNPRTRARPAILPRWHVEQRGGEGAHSGCCSCSSFPCPKRSCSPTMASRFVGPSNRCCSASSRVSTRGAKRAVQTSTRADPSGACSPLRRACETPRLARTSSIAPPPRSSRGRPSSPRAPPAPRILCRPSRCCALR